ISHYISLLNKSAMSSLLVTELFPPKIGGSIRFYWEVYRRLNRDNFVIAAGQDVNQNQFDRTHDLRGERMPLNFPSWGVCSPANLWRYWRAARRIRRLARDHRVDIIHCGRCLPEGLIALSVKMTAGIPYMCYVWGE